MNIRPVLAVAAISCVISTFGFLTPNGANAANPRDRHPQIVQQPPIPLNQLRRPDPRPQLKHRRPRPQLKKRLPQPLHRAARNQVRPIFIKP